MPQDLFTIKRYALELNNLLAGAKVNKVTQPNNDEVILTLYNGKVFNLTFNASAKFCRVCITNTLKESPLVAPNFCMLLRKHLGSSTILNVDVLNEDRIICVNFKSSSEFSDNETFCLITEVMGKYSNVFLTQNGTILGALKNTSQTLDYKRVNLVKSKYTLPEKQNKLSASSLENLKLCFKNYNGENLSAFILNNFNEFAPITAKELEHRILSKNNGVFNSKIAVNETLNFINETSAPNVIINGKLGEFYAVNYTSLNGQKKQFESVIEAMNYAYSNAENLDFITSKQNALMQKINAQEKKLIKKKALLESKVKESENSEIFKLYGELLTSYAYSIKKGQTSATLLNYYNNKEINVALDENLTATQNAQSYYKKYSKLKNTAIKTLPQIEKIDEELEYLEGVKLSVTLSKTKLDFNELEEELLLNSNAKIQKNDKKQPKKAVKSDYIRYEIDGFDVLIGKNSLQNDKLFKELSNIDLWFHVKNYTSCHAYVITKNKDVPANIILTVSQICAYYSKAKNEQKVSVDYTLKKHVKKQAGKGFGAVTYTNFKTVVVTPNENEQYKKMQ
ncbi:MAG: NFACT family protein [Clostridia bacterium]|nr:NFACT family protein [Clostridia bacterium]